MRIIRAPNASREILLKRRRFWKHEDILRRRTAAAWLTTWMRKILGLRMESLSWSVDYIKHQKIWLKSLSSVQTGKPYFPKKWKSRPLEKPGLLDRESRGHGDICTTSQTRWHLKWCKHSLVHLIGEVIIDSFQQRKIYWMKMTNIYYLIQSERFMETITLQGTKCKWLITWSLRWGYLWSVTWKHWKEQRLGHSLQQVVLEATYLLSLETSKMEAWIATPRKRTIYRTGSYNEQRYHHNRRRGHHNRRLHRTHYKSSKVGGQDKPYLKSLNRTVLKEPVTSAL